MVKTPAKPNLPPPLPPKADPSPVADPSVLPDDIAAAVASGAELDDDQARIHAAWGERQAALARGDIVEE